VAGTLDCAVPAAFAHARATGESVVLLSPAAASFDQFKSFEHRGECFAALAKAAA
jgi:UDP-N-acetylmuramoylalanine--D-glutamate ligase